MEKLLVWRMSSNHMDAYAIFKLWRVFMQEILFCFMVVWKLITWYFLCKLPDIFYPLHLNEAAEIDEITTQKSP